jgi:hypothetical protein
MNIEVLKKVAKDYKIQIPVVDEQYFLRNLTILYPSDTTYIHAIQIVNKWLELHKADYVCMFSNAVTKVLNEIIDYLKTKEPNSEKVESATCKSYDGFIEYSKGLNIFHSNNADKEFISVDMIKANEKALKFVEVLAPDESWQTLVERACGEDNLLFDYIYNSKALRQVAFGMYNSKLQKQAEIYITENLVEHIEKQLDIHRDNFIGYTNDEILLKSNDEVYSKIKTAKMNDDFIFNLFRVDKFLLKQIGDMQFYVKIHEDGSETYHNIPNTYLVQAIKKYKNIPINEDDLLFIYEGQKARFVEPLFK